MHRIDISFGVCLTFDFGQLLFPAPYQSSVLAHPLGVKTPFLSFIVCITSYSSTVQAGKERPTYA